MKWVLRILMILHLALMLYGVYKILFLEEFIHALKFIFVGITGFFLFLNAFLLIPIKALPNKILMFLSLILYTVTVLGFWSPVILKNYWHWLIALTLVVLLNSLYVRLVKNKKTWGNWLFPSMSLLVALPFTFSQPSQMVFYLAMITLGISSLYLFYKIIKN